MQASLVGRSPGGRERPTPEKLDAHLMQELLVLREARSVLPGATPTRPWAMAWHRPSSRRCWPCSPWTEPSNAWPALPWVPQKWEHARVLAERPGGRLAQCQDGTKTRLPRSDLASVLRPAHRRRPQLFDHKGPRHQRHLPRLAQAHGPGPFVFGASCCPVVRNLRVLDAFDARQADDARRRSAGLAPRSRRRRRRDVVGTAGSSPWALVPARRAARA